MTLMKLRHQLIQTIGSVLDNSENNPQVRTTVLYYTVVLEIVMNLYVVHSHPNTDEMVCLFECAITQAINDVLFDAVSQ